MSFVYEIFVVCNNLFISLSLMQPTTQKHKETTEQRKNTTLMGNPHNHKCWRKELFLAPWLTWGNEVKALPWISATPTPSTAAGSRPTARGGLAAATGTTPPATTPPGTPPPRRRLPRTGRCIFSLSSSWKNGSSFALIFPTQWKLSIVSHVQ